MTGVRALVGTAVRRLARGRCASVHYAGFLQRTVRCRLDAHHGAAHHFRAFDEVVQWESPTERPVSTARHRAPVARRTP